MISIKKAPRYLIIAAALKSALFVLPILMLYYGYKGVDIGDFFLIQGLSLLFVFVLEIPTGYIGDLFSRKKTVIVGCATWIVGYLCWMFGFGFWWILVGELFFALAVALVSGTIDAYLYDLLKRNNKEKNFHKKLAKKETAANLSLMFSTLIGAFLYQFFGPEAPIVACILSMVVCVGILMFLPDVPEARRQIERNKNKWQDIMYISKYAIKHPQIKWLMLFPAVYGVLTLTLMWGLQSVMTYRSVPVFMFSIIFGINSLMRVFCSVISAKLLEKTQLIGVVKILVLIIVIAYIGASLSAYVPMWAVYMCLGLMVLGSGSSVLSKIVTLTLINHRIQSDERATVLSVKSMIERAGAALGMIALKPLFDNVGVGETFMIAGFLIIPVVLLSCKLIKMKIN